MVASLEGAVKVEADPISCDAGVFISECEDERGVVTQTDTALSHTQAALRLAEKHHIWGQREVRVVLEGVAPQQLGCLGHALTTGLPRARTEKEKGDRHTNYRALQ